MHFENPDIKTITIRNVFVAVMEPFCTFFGHLLVCGPFKNHSTK